MIAGHDFLDLAAVDLGGGRQDHAVAQQRRRERLHVVGDDEVAPVERRPRPRRAGQHRAGARARARFQFRTSRVPRTSAAI